MIHSTITYPTLIIAHRGESYDAPENTLRAINLAWQNGADGIEIDVHLSSDNEIIVFHNKKIKTISGKSELVKSQTLKDLKENNVGRIKGNKPNNEKIPTLNEVLLTIPPNKYLFIEIKCGIEIIPYLKNVLHHYQVKTEQIKIIGFSFKKMTLIKNSFPEFEVLLNKRISIGKIFLGKSYWENLITNLKLNYLDGLNISYTKSLNFKLIETFKNNKLKLFVWTINKSEKALRLINFGIDGIMSDRAGWIREKINL